MNPACLSFSSNVISHLTNTVTFMTNSIGESRHVGHSIIRFKSIYFYTVNSLIVQYMYTCIYLTDISNTNNSNQYIYIYICLYIYISQLTFITNHNRIFNSNFTFVLSFQRYTQSMYSFHMLISYTHSHIHSHILIHVYSFINTHSRIHFI